MESLIIGMTAFQMLYFLSFAAFGQFFSIALQQVKYAPRIKAYGGFSILIWINENFWRVIVTLCAMIAGVLFTPQLTGQELTEWTAFLSGFATDKVIDSLLNRKDEPKP
jgi:hypothetical protein